MLDAGMDPAEVDAAIGAMPTAAETGPVELAEDDEAKAAVVFLRLGNSWRTISVGGGMAGTISMRTGLDLTVVPVVAGAYGYAVDPSLMNDLAVMETAALEVFADQARNNR